MFPWPWSVPKFDPCNCPARGGASRSRTWVTHISILSGRTHAVRSWDLLRVCTVWVFGKVRIADCLKVSVTKSEEPAQTGRAMLFSEYGYRPPSIILHMHSVAEANRLIHDHHLEAMLGVADVGPVHLAHELYHHLEGRQLTPGTAGFRIQTGQLGPFRFRTGLPSLCEIAADRFGGAVLGLATPPKALSFLTIHALNSEYAWGLLRRLRTLPE
jgi:hypothetical protein